LAKKFVSDLHRIALEEQGWDRKKTVDTTTDKRREVEFTISVIPAVR
jgi:hypothetical protein